MTVRTVGMHIMHEIGFCLRIALYTAGILYGILLVCVALSAETDAVFRVADMRHVLFGEAWTGVTVFVGVCVGLGVFLCRPMGLPQTSPLSNTASVPLVTGEIAARDH